MTLSLYNLFKNVINILLGIIAFFLVLRIVFLLFSANPATPFVSWILGVSSFLISPFFGITPNIGVATGVLDVVAAIALLAYLFAGYLIVAILRGLAQPQILREEEYDASRYHDIDRDREEELERPHRRKRKSTRR